MKWVLENIQILVIAAAIIAVWLNKLRSAPGSEEADASRGAGRDMPPGRERRPALIPDELKRQILEQLGVPMDPPRPSPPPPPPIPVVVTPPLTAPVVQPTIPPVPQIRVKPALEIRTRLPGRGRAIRAELKSLPQVRRAVVLREVLGKPVGLR